MRWAWFFVASVFMILPSFAQTRDEMVREDRRKVTADGFWIYNDLPLAFERAKETGKPILVVLRCIPCHECVKLDDDLVDKDPVLRPLLDQFVCVRQVSTNGLDLTTFQYDTDQSFAAFMLNADGTIYGRFGTRSHRTEWLTDVSLKGLAEALEGALSLHQSYPANRKVLAGKQGPEPEVTSPEKYPSLAAKYTDTLNYQGDVAKSCIHCHQIGEAQRSVYWSDGKPIPESVMFPYPHPKSLGLILDPDFRGRVKKVEPDSIAEATGFEEGDSIVFFGGQPPLSMADIQWVLHQTDPSGDDISVHIRRDGGVPMQLTMNLDAGWRREGDLSWRASTWSLRRIFTGGMVLEALSEEERREAGIDSAGMALRAKHVGQYGEHAAAKRAGLKKEDVIVSYGGRNDLMSERELMYFANNEFEIGEKVEIGYLRNGQKRTARIPIQK